MTQQRQPFSTFGTAIYFSLPEHPFAKIMKISVLFLALTCSAASAFAPQTISIQHATTSSSQLNLFGGGAKKDGEKRGPNMMDQMAMLKKAQEIAQKKSKLDQELSAMDFVGQSTDAKVKVTIKYVPSKNPMDPTPEYDPVSFEFDDEWYEGVSTEDLSTAVKEAIVDGMTNVNKGAEKKYAVLQSDIAGVFGGAAPPQS